MMSLLSLTLVLSSAAALPPMDLFTRNGSLNMVPGPSPAPPPPASPLPPLNIDPKGITISGISSGADFVVNLHVAHSSVISGVGVFAGQAYHCSVTRFPKDPLLPPNHNVPVCIGCPTGKTLEYDHCKQNPEYVDVDLLVAYARNQSALGTIDDVKNIASQPLYFYRGTHDTCYKSGAEEATLLFYSRLTAEVGMPDRGQAERIAYEGSVHSNHAQPTMAFGGPCGGYNKTASQLYSCAYAERSLTARPCSVRRAGAARTFCSRFIICTSLSRHRELRLRRRRWSAQPHVQRLQRQHITAATHHRQPQQYHRVRPVCLL